MFTKLFSFIICSFLSFQMFADCTIAGSDPPNKSWGALVGQTEGQTFTACKTGTINQLTIYIDIANENTGTHIIRFGDGSIPSTAILSPGGTIVGSYKTTAGVGGPVTIDFTTPFPVTEGNIYAWEFTIAGAGIHFIQANEGSDLDGGNGYLFIGSSFSDEATFEKEFSLTIIEPQSIPTLGDWGIISLSLTMLTVGMVAVKQRKISITTN